MVFTTSKVNLNLKKIKTDNSNIYVYRFRVIRYENLFMRFTNFYRNFILQQLYYNERIA